MNRFFSVLSVLLILVLCFSSVSAAVLNTAYPWSSTTTSSNKEKYFTGVVSGTIDHTKSYGMAKFVNNTESASCEMKFGSATTGNVSIDGNLHYFLQDKTCGGGSVKSGFYRSMSGPSVSFTILGSIK